MIIIIGWAISSVISRFSFPQFCPSVVSCFRPCVLFFQLFLCGKFSCGEQTGSLSCFSSSVFFFFLFSFSRYWNCSLLIKFMIRTTYITELDVHCTLRVTLCPRPGLAHRLFINRLTRDLKCNEWWSHMGWHVVRELSPARRLTGRFHRKKRLVHLWISCIPAWRVES